MLFQGVGLVQSDEAETQRIRGHAPGHRRPCIGRHCTARVVSAAVGAPIQDLREQRVSGDRGIGHQPNAGNRTLIERRRSERALGKQADLGTQAALAGCDVEQLQEGAVTHHDLSRERVGLGQQTGEVAAKQDLVGLANIDQPRWQVVRMRRQDRLAENPAPQVGLLARSLPCGNGALQHLLAAPCDGHGRDAGASSSSETNEIASIHDALPSGEASTALNLGLTHETMCSATHPAIACRRIENAPNSIR